MGTAVGDEAATEVAPIVEEEMSRMERWPPKEKEIVAGKHREGSSSENAKSGERRRECRGLEIT